MLTVEPSFDSLAGRTGSVTNDAARRRVVRGKRHGHRRAPETGPGEAGWWCAEMRSVLWATLGAVAATALLLYALPALF